MVILGSGDHEKVWREHCQDKELLSEYADAMHHLATDIWTKHPETRIDWCRSTCMEFFHQGGLKKVLDKAERRRLFNSDHRCSSGITSGESESTSSGESSLRNDISGSFSSAQGQSFTVQDSKHAISPVTSNSFQKEHGATVHNLQIIPSHTKSAPKEFNSIHSELLNSVESTGDERNSCVENEMIFGPPDGSFGSVSQNGLAGYKPRKYNTM